MSHKSAPVVLAKAELLRFGGVDTRGVNSAAGGIARPDHPGGGPRAVGYHYAQTPARSPTGLVTITTLSRGPRPDAYEGTKAWSDRPGLSEWLQGGRGTTQGHDRSEVIPV